MLIGPTVDPRELSLRRTPFRMRPLAYYQNPLPCGDRAAGLDAAQRYDQASRDNRIAVLGAETIDEVARVNAQRRMVAALDELRELGGNDLVQFVALAGRHCRRLEYARKDGSLRDYHISWSIAAGQMAALSIHTFGAIFWVA